jgi:sodium-dependent dicarboxylate transporter 2/3/5
MLENYQISVGFLPYLLVGLPFVLLFLPVIYLALSQLCLRERISAFTRDIIEGEVAKLGRMSRGEKLVLAVFLVTCACWILNEPIRLVTGLKVVDDPIAGRTIEYLKSDEFDGCLAMLAGLALFLLPLRWDRGALQAGALKKFPWDSLILLGGSFALAAVVQRSGLSGWLGRHLQTAASLPPLELMLVITTSTVFLSAFSSNTATATVMMQLVATALGPGPANAARVAPYLSGVTIAASCDFMLPAGTPPNAIVFGTRCVSIRTMASVGAVLDVAAAVIAGLWVYFGASRLLPLVLPELAK